MRRLWLLIAVALLALPGCGEDDPATRPNDFTRLTSIEIVSPHPAIAVQTSNTFSAIGTFFAATTQTISLTVAP